MRAGIAAAADRHEVGDHQRAGLGLELGAQDVGAGQVGAAGGGDVFGQDFPRAAALGVQDAKEHRVGVEAAHAAPVDAALAADEGAAVAIAD